MFILYDVIMIWDVSHALKNLWCGMWCVYDVFYVIYVYVDVMDVCKVNYGCIYRQDMIDALIWSCSMRCMNVSDMVMWMIHMHYGLTYL